MNFEQSKIIAFYLGFIISTIGMFTPYDWWYIPSSLFVIIGLLYLYIERLWIKKASLTYNHSCFITKSIWISSLLFIIGAIIAGLLGDHTTITHLSTALTNGIAFDQDQLKSILLNYGQQNLWLFLACLTPSGFYLLYRLAKGIIYAAKNTLIPNPKNWL